MTIRWFIVYLALSPFQVRTNAAQDKVSASLTKNLP